MHNALFPHRPPGARLRAPGPPSPRARGRQGAQEPGWPGAKALPSRMWRHSEAKGSGITPTWTGCLSASGPRAWSCSASATTSSGTGKTPRAKRSWIPSSTSHKAAGSSPTSRLLSTRWMARRRTPSSSSCKRSCLPAVRTPLRSWLTPSSSPGLWRSHLELWKAPGGPRWCARAQVLTPLSSHWYGAWHRSHAVPDSTAL